MVVRPRHPVAGALWEKAVAVGQPAPRRVGDGEHVVGAVSDKGEAELLEHVRADAVRAEHDVVGASGRPSVADGVVHVAARVVGDRPRQDTVEQHTVDEQPLLGGQHLQPGAGSDVGGTLGDVDVHAGAQIGGQSGGCLERLVAARERGVDTDEAAPTGA